MPAYGTRYVVNETYRSSTDPEKDQFQGWLNGPIDTGIRNSGGIRAIANPETGDREFLVFITSDGSTKNPNPWEDVINMQEGTARYWGDAKARHRPDPDEATGNNWVKTDYTETYAQGNRKDAPPVLLFEQPETGQVTFRGLCILTGMSIERHKDDDGETVVNYLFDLAILDTDAVELEWILVGLRTGGEPRRSRDTLDLQITGNGDVPWIVDVRTKALVADEEPSAPAKACTRQSRPPYVHPSYERSATSIHLFLAQIYTSGPPIGTRLAIAQ